MKEEQRKKRKSSSTTVDFFFIFSVFMYEWRPEEDLWEAILPLPQWVPGTAQVLGLGGKCPYHQATSPGPPRCN